MSEESDVEMEDIEDEIIRNNNANTRAQRLAQRRLARGEKEEDDISPERIESKKETKKKIAPMTATTPVSKEREVKRKVTFSDKK
jgi:hypothetical protein